MDESDLLDVVVEGVRRLIKSRKQPMRVGPLIRAFSPVFSERGRMRLLVRLFAVRALEQRLGGLGRANRGSISKKKEKPQLAV